MPMRVGAKAMLRADRVAEIIGNGPRTEPSYLWRCNGNTRLVGSHGSTETYPSTTRTCITRLGYFPS